MKARTFSSAGNKWQAAVAAEKAWGAASSNALGSKPLLGQRESSVTLESLAQLEEGEGGSAPAPSLPDGLLSGDELKQYVGRLAKHMQAMTLAVKEQVDGIPRRSRRRALGAGEPPSASTSKRNPYRGLMALQRLGLVQNCADVRGMAVAVVGLGRTGAPVAEMLARCGVGKLLLVDRSDVCVSHLGGLVYRPEHVGLPKTQALRLVLRTINPDVEVRGMHLDVEKDKASAVLRRKLLAFYDGEGGGAAKAASAAAAEAQQAGGPAVDLLCCCLDSRKGRSAANRLCLELGVPLISTRLLPGAEQSALCFVMPGQTACLHCTDEVPGDGPDTSDGTSKKADFPGAALMLAGMVAQTALKFLLEFGDVSPRFSHKRGEGRSFDQSDSAWACSSWTEPPSPMCAVALCRARQREFGSQRSEGSSEEGRRDYDEEDEEDEEEEEEVFVVSTG